MKKGACCSQKAVLVTVYVERPKRQVHRREPQIRHPITQALLPRRGGGGYDRRAELLRFSQGLRKSPRPAANTQQNHSSTHIAPHNQQPTTKIVAVQVRQRNSSLSTFLGNLKISMPALMRSSRRSNRTKERKKYNSGSITKKMNAMMKSFQAQKKSGFFSKLLSKFRK